MFYFSRFIGNETIKFIVVGIILTIIFYFLGRIVQRFFKIKVLNYNISIPIGLCSYLFITFIFYTPFIYFGFSIEDKIYTVVYLIEQVILLFVLVLMIFLWVRGLKKLNYNLIFNLVLSFLIILSLTYLFSFFSNTFPSWFNVEKNELISSENLFYYKYQTSIYELFVIYNIDGTIAEEMFTKLLPFVFLSVVYWTTSSLFKNSFHFLTVIISTFVTICFLFLFGFIGTYNSLFIEISLIYLYLGIIFQYLIDVYKETKFLKLSLFILFIIFTFSINAFPYFIILGLPLIIYSLFKEKEKIVLFLIYSTLLSIIFVLIISSLSVIFGIIFSVFALFILIPVYSLVKNKKLDDLIKTEETLENNNKKIFVVFLIVLIVIPILFLILQKPSILDSLTNFINEKNIPWLFITMIILYLCLYIFSIVYFIKKSNELSNINFFFLIFFIYSLNPVSFAFFYYIGFFFYYMGFFVSFLIFFYVFLTILIVLFLLFNLLQKNKIYL